VYTLLFQKAYFNGGSVSSLYIINLALFYYVELEIIGLSAYKLILYEHFPKYVDE